MPIDRTDSGLPDADLPEQQGLVPSQRSDQVPQSLAVELIPIVDEIRQIAVDLGLRAYQVFLVHEAWTGDRRGVGETIEISRREILPTPRIRDMTNTTEMLRAVGLTEEGGIVVDQISGHYTEDDLMGRTQDLADPVIRETGASNVMFYWEVVQNQPTRPQPIRRRYHPSAAPNLSRDGVQWRIVLATAQPQGRRGATGRPQ